MRMHLEIQTHRKQPIGLLVSAKRIKGKINKTIHARFTCFDLPMLKLIQAGLQNKVMTASDFVISSSKEYGASSTLLKLAKQLELDKTIYSRTSETWVKIILATVIAKIVFSGSKLSISQTVDSTSLYEHLGIENEMSNVNNVYSAMDKLLNRKEEIEKKLIKKHCNNKEFFLYDITSSYLMGEYEDSELVTYGYNRDKKSGTKQIVIGLACNKEGVPVSIDVFKGNTKYSQTVEGEIKKWVENNECKELTFIGDRGMISPENLKKIDIPNVKSHGITALTHSKIKSICKEKEIDKNKLKNTGYMIIDDSKEYKNYRIAMYYNELKDEKDKQARQSLIDKTIVEFKKIESKKREVDDATVGERLGKVKNKYKVGKYFNTHVENGKLFWSINEDKLSEAEKYDGMYGIITDLIKEELEDEAIVQEYRKLNMVEQSFRTLKSDLLELRPIYHHKDSRIISHVFICFLSYYLIWHVKDRLKNVIQSKKSSLKSIIEMLSTIQENICDFNGQKIKKITQASEKIEEIQKLILKD